MSYFQRGRETVHIPSVPKVGGDLAYRPESLWRRYVGPLANSTYKQSKNLGSSH